MRYVQLAVSAAVLAVVTAFIRFTRATSRTRSDLGATATARRRNGQSTRHVPIPGEREQETMRTMQNRQHDDCEHYKELFFKVQNIEEYPDILHDARQTLFSLLLDGLAIEKAEARRPSILDIESPDMAAIREFVLAEHTGIMDEWEAYAQRRAQGGPRELFKDRPSAVHWLKQWAPVKFVDGAWLGHVHKITTPYIFRGVTKDAWQILSEELGDGDVAKNHVKLYTELLQEAGVSLSAGHDADFIHARHEMNDTGVWRSAVAQLLISLFPHDFLPEILGFNMHYELLTMQTLQASRELPELGLSGYYFHIHVSIDNADSGHTAMALGTVLNYLDIVRNQEASLVQETWRRIQTGYILSKTANQIRPLSNREEGLLKMLRLKADASHQIHCTSRVKIGQQTLAQWLSPNSWNDSREGKRQFLQGLSSAKPWIHKGQSARSRLIRELSWKGRMFGAFTNAEVQELKAWIDGMDPGGRGGLEDKYWTSVRDHGTADINVTPAVIDVVTHHPVFESPPSISPLALSSKMGSATIDLTMPSPRPLDITKASPSHLLPLWFTHPCLLENMVCIPSRTTTPIASHFLRILRAECGLLEETTIVAGMDEQHRLQSSPSLVSLGLEMSQRLGRSIPLALKDVIEDNMEEGSAAVEYSRTLLTLALRPVQNQPILMGLSLAFLDLEAAIVLQDELLSKASREALQHIVKRKRSAFVDCFSVLAANQDTLRTVILSYAAGRDQIQALLSSGGGVEGRDVACKC